MPEQVVPLYRTKIVKRKNGSIKETDVVYKNITIVYPIIYNREKYYGYGICKEDGSIWSSRSGFWKQMKPSVSGKSPYPKFSASMKGSSKTLSAHIAVHETLNPDIPKPVEIPNGDWAKTPDSVKQTIRSQFQVNHIDHDHTNYHPSNLEWVTGPENAQRYQIYRIKHLTT